MPPIRRLAVGAGLLGAAAVAAHVVFVPTVALAALPLLVRPGRGRRPAALALALSSVPCWPLVVERALAPTRGLTAPLGGMAHAHGLGSLLDRVGFEGLDTGFDHLRLYFACFDHRLTQDAHAALTAAAALCLLLRRRPFGRADRYVTYLLLGHFALFWLVPLKIHGVHSEAWLLNLRYLVLVDAALLALALPRPGAWSRRAAQAAALGVALGVAVFLVGMARAAWTFEAAVAYLDPLARALPEGAALPAPPSAQRFGKGWPPLEHHAWGYLVPHPACTWDGLFAGGHIPIRRR